MKLAIFGGTGFLGYDFVKLVSACPEIEVTVYSTNPKSLVNLARHELDIRLVEPGQVRCLDIDPDSDYVINFSHPFAVRDELSPREQLDQFVDFLERQKQKIPSLRLVHLSTMSVYEPFDQDTYYPEGRALDPPRADAYACDKVYVESRLRGLAEADKWQLLLRPTIVYGPFCRPWTDKIMQALLDGALHYRDLSGRIQPIYGHDISRFIHQSLIDFRPGTYNLAGDEEVTWQEFLGFFEDLVGVGQLRHDPRARPSEHGPSVGFWRLFKDSTRELMSVIAGEESFIRMAQPIVRKLPRGLVVWVRDHLFGGISDNVSSKPPVLSPFASDFFGEHRLVGLTELRRDYPEFEFTPMSGTRDLLARYFRFRFTDIPLQ